MYNRKPNNANASSGHCWFQDPIRTHVSCKRHKLIIFWPCTSRAKFEMHHISCAKSEMHHLRWIWCDYGFFVEYCTLYTRTRYGDFREKTPMTSRLGHPGGENILRIVSCTSMYWYPNLRAVPTRRYCTSCALCLLAAAGIRYERLFHLYYEPYVPVEQ